MLKSAESVPDKQVPVKPEPGEPWSRSEFERRLRAKGARYHIHHPFHIAMNSGQCTPEQIRGWVANRFYYQVNIPIKDAAILANCDDRAVRQQWIQRIIDHDGLSRDGRPSGNEGGIEAWLRLGEACGLSREELLDHRHLLPGVRFAVDAYVNFARRATWQEAACSSLTELFAPTIHQRRLDSWPDYYTWIEPSGYHYFRSRLTEARRDVEHGLRVTLDHFKTRQQQEHALSILQFKLDILWSMLDAMTMAYVHQTPPYHDCETPDDE
jgi:pyrroloquinoline-quinone synthase